MSGTQVARTVKTFRKGEAILREGSSSSGELYYLHRGTCRAEVGSQAVGRIESGEFFGEVASILQTDRTATVRALTECTVLVFKGLDDANLYEVIRNDQKILRKLIEQIALRLVETSRGRSEADREGNDAAERFRRCLSGTVYALEKIRAGTKDPFPEELLGFIRGTSGIREGKREDLDVRYFPRSSNRIS